MEEAKKRRIDSVAGGEASVLEAQLDLSKLKPMKQVISLLKPEEMVDILAQAALRHDNVAELVQRVVGKEPPNRKIFVRGLDFETTSESIHRVYSAYGEIEEHMVIRDKATGKSRGFGFVTFKDIASVLKALEEPSKLIDGRMSVCQLAVLGSRAPQEDILERKIFVGNVHSEVSQERLLEFFSQYGDVDEGPIGFDRVSKKSRGYAIFVYKTVEGARNALAEPNKLIDGHQMFCKLAGDPKGKLAAQQQKQQMNHQQHQQHQQQSISQPSQYQSQQDQLSVQPVPQPYVQGAMGYIPQTQQPGNFAAVQPAMIQQPGTVYAVPGTISGPAVQPQYGYASSTSAPAGTTVYVSTPQGVYSAMPTQQPQQPGGATGFYVAPQAVSVAGGVPPGPAGYTLMPAAIGQGGSQVLSLQQQPQPQPQPQPQQQQQHHQQQASAPQQTIVAAQSSPSTSRMQGQGMGSGALQGYYQQAYSAGAQTTGQAYVTSGAPASAVANGTVVHYATGQQQHQQPQQQQPQPSQGTTVYYSRQ